MNVADGGSERESDVRKDGVSIDMIGLRQLSLLIIFWFFREWTSIKRSRIRSCKRCRRGRTVSSR